mmetsp:Transcript_355/g.475  ORF Transcript_355/g.475 Transcript_355/m.475 type:complete len:214 (+) Transcript_355:119-760(+)
MNRIAIDLNNAACGAIDKGHLKIGAQILMLAIQSLHCATSSNAHANCQEDFDEKLLNANKIVTGLSDAASPTKCNVNPYFVYTRAFKIKPDGPHSSNLHGTSLIILYNTALTSHLRALSSGRSKELQKTILKYKLAMDSIMQFNGGCQEIKLVFVAGLNNMGQIYHHFAEYDKAEACFKRVSQHLDIDIQDSEEIALNLVMRQCSSGRLAPAA